MSPSTPGALNVISGYDGSSYAVSPSAADPTTAAHVTSSSVAYVGGNTDWLGRERIGNGSYDTIAGSLDGLGGVLDFFTFPHFRPVILSPTTGEVVSN